MFWSIRAVLAILLLLGSVFALDSLKPVTVCEVLSDPFKYDGKTVSVLGRSESDDSRLICCFLAEDRCDKSPRSDVWPNKIWVNCCDELPIGRTRTVMAIDPTWLLEKLIHIRQTTPLLVRKKVDFKADGDVLRQVGWRDVKDQWEVAYGRVEISDQLKSKQKSVDQPKGFGDPPIAGIQIVIRDIPHYLDEESMKRPTKGQVP
jgi:hypothetical protein